ncbi:MAG: HEAT repeat domain-containing protein [Labilithrix sp.]|nr:HEAT repeat domain-containing protein [Labilithrix sp.]MCW5809501.1 HEAT repeat domain-containing protein [Labilithrix sp.]
MIHAAKWPPDDDDAVPPGLPGAPGGFAPGGYGDDGNFKRGRFAPIAIIVGILAVGGIAGALIFGSLKDSEKMDPKKVAAMKKETALLPIAEAIPTYRKWAEQDNEKKLQEEGFTQLAWAKDPQGLQLIIKGLSSIDHNIRGTAAQALLEYGSPAADAAKPALLKAFKESTEADRPQIAWALAALHEPSAWDDVMKEYRAGKLSSVQRLDKSPAFDPELMASMVSTDKLATLAGDESESVRQLVATVLSRTADPKYTSTLIKLVKDKSIDVAREAAVGLGRIANEEAMNPLLEALTKSDKESRPKFLEAMRDGVGGKGLVLALQSVDKSNPNTQKHQTKQLFDMLRELEDPRAGDALAQYLETNPHPHWKTEAALRLAEIGDLRAVPVLGWRMEQDPLKLYSPEEEELRRDDNERVVSARMLADLALLYPDKRPDIRAQSYKGVWRWLTDKPQPHANGLRYVAAVDAKEALPQMRKWANPAKPLPKEGEQRFPDEWGTAQSALRYLGWMQDASSWGVLESQLRRRPEKVDATMDSLLQGGQGVLGMTLRAIGVGASHGFAQWGDPKAYPVLVKYIEDKMNNEQSRVDACFSLAWVATDENMVEVAKKVKELTAGDPKTQFIRTCYLETLVHRPVPSANATLAELINGTSDLNVQHQAARAIGFGGMSPETTANMFEKLSNPATRNDAMLAILIGGDPDMARRALASYEDIDRTALEELKVVYNATFGYWSDKNYESGDVARWIANAQSASRVKLGDAIQDWPRLVLSRAVQGIDYDNGPHSTTRVQMRIKLLRDAKGSDAVKRSQAIQILKFMNEKGCLMALKSESGPGQEDARRAFFELMNPKMTTDALPPEAKASGTDPLKK